MVNKMITNDYLWPGDNLVLMRDELLDMNSKELLEVSAEFYKARGHEIPFRDEAFKKALDELKVNQDFRGFVFAVADKQANENSALLFSILKDDSICME